MKKITKAQLLKYVSFGILSAALIVPIPLLIYSTTSNTRNFVLGNYQSYMSPTVMSELNKQYELEYDYFETSEDVKKLLKKNTIDISNTTSYDLVDLIQENLVSKVDWKRFNLQIIDTNNPNVSIPIENANDALQLFTQSTQEVLTSYSINNVAINLLDYGVPYFIQDLVFVYRGQQINQLSGSVNWKDVLNVISTEDRFKPKQSPQIISLDDPRTIYSIPRSIQTNPSNINPNQNASIDDLQSTYQLLSDSLNKLGNNSINLNSDSSTVLNIIASGQMNGGIMFNGDAIYASYGGDNQVAIDENDFHVVKPNDTVVALDMMIMNSQMTDSDKIDKSYNIFKQLCLNNGGFEASDVDPDHPSLTYQNFDQVNYTPTLNVIYEYVYNNYFDVWQQPMVEININTKGQIELALDNLLKSNFNFAWVGFKSSLK